MKLRKLGGSDLQLSVLGMGCWQYGGGAYWGEQNQRDVDEVVHAALDAGINYFDTAEVYNDGDSERSLGLALRGRRAQAVIGSKISTSNVAPQQLRAHCEASLSRLNTDYIDLYMIHWPINESSVRHFAADSAMATELPAVQDVMEALDDLRREGKIRYIGVSNHGIGQMKQLQATGVPVVANELAYNLFSRAIEAEILPYCQEHGFGVIGYTPLLQGVLTGKYRELDEIRPNLCRTRHFHYSRGAGTRHGEEGAEAEIVAALEGMRVLAQQLGMPMSELALAWALSNPGIASTITGSRNVEQLEMNLRAAQTELPTQAMEQLDRLTGPVLLKLGNNPDYYENRHHSRVY